ncbi:hypothetical protein H0H81_004965 [Sphagnurus paluster]|uniref:DNA-directed RNA polymerase III subunit n=1 Tax=Sphagnurus paluster TaxID=117069 RepID=A0A9P7GL44_9AGAR|nr:hypothetical protein H0H81_004965 [Sphagnurus paluster]
MKFVDRDMYMRYAGSGVGHYRVPLRVADIPITDSTSKKQSPPPNENEDEPTESKDMASGARITIEALRNPTDAAGPGVVGVDDRDADVKHEDELTLDEEDDGDDGEEADIGYMVTAEIDEYDIGAEDGEDGAEEFDDQAGYADL